MQETPKAVDTFLVEQVCRIELASHTIRVWGDFVLARSEIDDAVNRMRRGEWSIRNANLRLAASMLAEISGVNSVEIVDRTGYGVCVHKNWP